jgi:hypothetical protein
LRTHAARIGRRSEPVVTRLPDPGEVPEKIGGKGTIQAPYCQAMIGGRACVSFPEKT